MIKYPVVKPIGDPSKQPKVAQNFVKGNGNKKPPCRFCKEVRAKVVKVAASWFNR